MNQSERERQILCMNAYIWNLQRQYIHAGQHRKHRYERTDVLNSVRSVSQFSRSIGSDSLWPHESQHTRPPCPSPTPITKLMSIESVMPSNHLILCCPLLLLPQSPPASGSFPMSQLFTPGGQSIRVSASTSVPPMNPQDWSPSGWTGWISSQSKGLSRFFSNTTVQKHQFFGAQLSSQSYSHLCIEWCNDHRTVPLYQKLFSCYSFCNQPFSPTPKLWWPLIYFPLVPISFFQNII